MKFIISFCVLLQIISTLYNSDLGLQYLYYAKIALCEKQEILAWNCGSCVLFPSMKEIAVVQDPELKTQSYQSYDQKNNNIVVSFRGSDNLENWEQDINFPKISYPACQKCQVHKGFYQVWKVQEEQVINNVRILKKQNPDARIVVTGHSLGGTTTLLAALSLYQNGLKADEVYTYGCPRIGNTYFAQYAYSVYPNNQRIVHMRDPVPHLPLELMGFHHVPTEIWYNNPDNSQQYKVCDENGIKEDPQCSNSQVDDVASDHIHYLGIGTGCGLNSTIFQSEIREQLKYSLKMKEKRIIYDN